MVCSRRLFTVVKEKPPPPPRTLITVTSVSGHKLYLPVSSSALMHYSFRYHFTPAQRQTWPNPTLFGSVWLWTSFWAKFRKNSNRDSLRRIVALRNGCVWSKRADIWKRGTITALPGEYHQNTLNCIREPTVCRPDPGLTADMTVNLLISSAFVLAEKVKTLDHFKSVERLQMFHRYSAFLSSQKAFESFFLMNVMLLIYFLKLFLYINSPCTLGHFVD